MSSNKILIKITAFNIESTYPLSYLLDSKLAQIDASY